MFFKYEFIGKKLNIGKVEYRKEDPLLLSYGKGNGFLPGVSLVSTGKQSQFEILIVQGGNKNLDVSVYGETCWHLPKNATLVYEGKNMRLTTKAEALADGVAGESIPVRNVQSKRELYGVVRDAETVTTGGAD